MCSLSQRPPVLSNPTIGVMAIAPAGAAAYVKRDAAFLTTLFGDVEVMDATPPKCDVLFVYATFSPDGSVIGSMLGLREIIRDSGALIVVVASGNTPESYVKAGAPRPYGQANLVMTLDRRGQAFERFLAALFAKMKSGVSMPDAWIQLSPQVSGGVDGSIPEMMFACELGPLSFA